MSSCSALTSLASFFFPLYLLRHHYTSHRFPGHPTHTSLLDHIIHAIIEPTIPSNTHPASPLRNQFEMDLRSNPRDALMDLITSFHDLNPQLVMAMPPPTSLDYLRCVHRNLPVVFRGAVSHWDAVGKWNETYLREKMGRSQIVVAETPLGYVATSPATRVRRLTCMTRKECGLAGDQTGGWRSILRQTPLIDHGVWVCEMSLFPFEGWGLLT